jgi:hypothetical protein
MSWRPWLPARFCRAKPLNHGLSVEPAELNNSDMPRENTDFRQTAVFGWDEEPHDERPSEFMQSTGYSVLSGYHVPSDLNARAARRTRGSSGVGFKTIVFAFVMFLGVAGFAIHHFVKYLR